MVAVMSDDFEVSTSIVAVLVATVLAFCVAYWVWPWLGPQLFTPCPVWTGLGVGAYTAWSVLRSCSQLMREARLKRIERKCGLRS